MFKGSNVSYMHHLLLVSCPGCIWQVLGATSLLCKWNYLKKWPKFWKLNSWGQMRIRWGKPCKNRNTFPLIESGGSISNQKESCQSIQMNLLSCFWECIQGSNKGRTLWCDCILMTVSRTKPHTSFGSFDVPVILLKPWKTKFLVYK